MLRRRVALRPDGFRARREEPGRIEAFADGVFAFALTLLVVSLEVPRTFDDLAALLGGFAGFALSFAMVLLLWRLHVRYFRRFGLTDETTVWLNGALLFVLLFYVYPLKFVAALTSRLLGAGPGPAVRPDQLDDLMVLFGGGYVAVFALFALLYAHAYRLRDALDLNEEERVRTRGELGAMGLQVAIGGLSVAVALVGGPRATLLASGVYVLVGPALALHRRGVERRAARLTAERPTGAGPDLAGAA